MFFSRLYCAAAIPVMSRKAKKNELSVFSLLMNSA
jgi:hypothetical protein